MSFQPEDFFVGMIAYYTVTQLRRDTRLRNCGLSRDSKPRPFLCFAEDEGESYWIALTTQKSPYRMSIHPSWVRYAKGRFLKGGLSIYDARDTVAGPIVAFSKMSNQFDRAKGLNGRMMLVPEGVEAIHAEVIDRGGLSPVTESRYALAAA